MDDDDGMILMEPVIEMEGPDEEEMGMPPEVQNMMRLTEAMMAPPPSLFGGRIEVHRAGGGPLDAILK